MTTKQAPPKLRLGYIARVSASVLYPSLGTRVPHFDKEGWYVVALEDLGDPYNAEFPEIRVAPISDNIAMASDLDLVVRADDGPFGSPVLVEIWNQRAMLVANIDEVVGVLPEHVVTQLCALHNEIVGLRSAAEVLPPGSRGSIIEDDADPRYSHQRERAAAAEFLSRPTEELLSLRQGDEFERQTHDADRHQVTIILATDAFPLSDASLEGLRWLYAANAEPWQRSNSRDSRVNLIEEQFGTWSYTIKDFHYSGDLLPTPLAVRHTTQAQRYNRDLLSLNMHYAVCPVLGHGMTYAWTDTDSWPVKLGTGSVR